MCVIGTLLRGLLAVVLLVGSVAAQDLFINEFMAVNSSTLADDTGDYDDWVEIYNAGSEAVNLAGMYLTDDLAEPTKCQISAADAARTTIQAGEYLIFWFDDDSEDGILHLDMQLSGDGEDIGLFAADGVTEIDSVTYGAQTVDVSYGRYPDGGDEWFFYDTPSPNSANDDSGIVRFANPPEFSHTRGFYSGAVSLQLTADSGARVFYTLDGSEPTDGASQTAYTYRDEDTSATSTRYYRTYAYSGPINVASTTTVRARTFQDGFLPSRPVTHTFLIADASTLPVVSLSTSPNHLWDDQTGIYVMGPDPGDPQLYKDGNVWQDWERPVHVELIEPDGTVGLAQDAGMKIAGGTTRLGPQKSLALFARSDYGRGEFNYQIFPELDHDEFEALMLRNSGDDWVSTLIRDGVMVGLVADLDVDAQAFRPAAVYVNGVYWGIHNIREKMNEHYLADHHDVDPDNVDMLEEDLDVIEGDASHYESLLTYIRTHDMTQPQSYTYVKTLMDVENFIDYQASQIYCANTDWPGNNIKYWRPRTTDGKWRWLLFDTDFGFAFPASNSVSANDPAHDTLDHCSTRNVPHWSNPEWSIELFATLLENGEFRNEFIRRMADLLNVTFDPDRVTDMIDERADLISGEMGDHVGRWGGVTNPWSGSWSQGIPSVGFWQSKVNILRNFASVRPDYVRGHVVNKFGLAGTATVAFSVTSAGSGLVKVNRMLNPEGTWSGTYFRGIPITLTAVPGIGYRFVEWQGDVSGASSPVSLNVTGDRSVQAVFEEAEYTLSVQVQGQGSVDPNGGTYDANVEVELNAEPADGWVFDHWGGDLSGSGNPATIVMDDDKSVIAVFVTAPEPPSGYRLTVQIEGEGSVDPNGGTFDVGAQVELTATADSGWQFDHWEGDFSGSANPLTIAMSGDYTVKAVFVPVSIAQYVLTVRTHGDGSVDPAGGVYAAGAQVELTATADAGWRFSRWVGDLSSDANPSTVTMNANKTITAVFVEEETPRYTLSVGVTGLGSVTPSSRSYDAGTEVQVRAVASEGWVFDHWEGDLSGSTNPAAITMDGDKTVRAVFMEASSLCTLTVTIEGQGQVDKSSGTYSKGTVVALTATPADGWIFLRWEGDCAGTDCAAQITMDGDKSVKAVFGEESITPPISGGCFIATAAYGSELEPHVATLRDFRDKHLVTNAPGRWFVRTYYRLSPPVATVIAVDPQWRTAVRAALTPVVLTVVHPIQAAAAMTIPAIGLIIAIGRRRITRRSGPAGRAA